MVGAEGIEASIYIYHLGVEFKLPTLPESITDTMNISFYQQSVLARSAPHITLSTVGPRTTQVDIVIHRHIFALENPKIDEQAKKSTVKITNPVDGSQIDVETTDAADYLINAIMSLSLPKYTDSTKMIVPPSLRLRWGNEMVIRGVPGTVAKTSSGPWLKSGKQALVSLSFQVVEVEPYSAQYVAQNGSIRGLSTDLTRSGVWQW